MKIELVTWRDAGGSSDDHTWMESDDNPIIRSVGWVVKETENNLTLAMDLAEDDTTNGRSRIPKGMIVSREIIY